MDLNVGDRVKVRNPKDLYNEFGGVREPYQELLGFPSDVYKYEVGIISKAGISYNHPSVRVQYDNGFVWWYYPEVLVKCD